MTKEIFFRKELFIKDMEKRRGTGETLLSELNGTYDWVNWLNGVNLFGRITGPMFKEKDSELYQTILFNPNKKQWETMYVEKRWLQWGD
jgi:hypothetical protein